MTEVAVTVIERKNRRAGCLKPRRRNVTEREIKIRERKACYQTSTRSSL